MPAKNRKSAFKKVYTSPTMLVLVVLVLALTSWAIYETGQNHTASLDTTSRLAYVDGSDAVAQVSNFYQQYLASTAKPDFQKTLIGAYGDQNLVFYNNYYQHGFDPITCSTEIPTSVIASLISTGPVATVEARATYPNHTTATITAKVTLTDALKIDSITCPGDKGNLPPASIN